MAFEFKRVGIKHIIASVTGVAPTEVIPAASGFITSVTAIIATNQAGSTNSIALWDGLTKLTPSIPVPTLGTLFIDDFGGVQVELTRSSGLFVGLSSGGNFEFQVHYLQYDKRTPITKAQSRTATYNNVTVSRGQG